METKKLIEEMLQEGIEVHKRRSMVKSILDKAANKLFDAYRELDMALQYCDDQEIRQSVEDARTILGYDKQMAGYSENEATSVISKLQDIASKLKY